MTRYSNKKLDNAGIATISIHAGVIPDPVTGAIIPPIYQTATYAQEAVGVNKGHTYSRSSNPTVSMLEKKLSAIEGESTQAVCFATGMAAITALTLSMLAKDEHIVSSDVMFGGTVRFFDNVLAKYGISVTYVDAANPKNVADAIRPNTKMIFLETPANPTLKLTDIKTVSAIAHKHNIAVVVDNTFLGILQKPFELGADIIMYSTTKYIDGHNSSVGGALLAREQKYIDDFYLMRKTTGNIQSPFDAWLIAQGLKTLELRMNQHSYNAMQVALYLEQHAKVSKVVYPGLKSFPQHELAMAQHIGNRHGGMLVFEVAAGYDAAIKLMNSTELAALAESLGSTESLITHPASMTHAAMTKESRHAIGLTDGMIRFSAGLENYTDIIADLEQALAKIG
jgi:cystathionine beta-lyase/cystathionine gamma-synthase